MSDTDQPAPPKPHRHAPRAFWLIAQHFIGVLYSLFGDSADLARQHTLTAKAYKLTRAWIAVAEALLRRLLLIEAAAYTTAPPSRPRAPRQHERKLFEFHPDTPDEWRVSFNCIPSVMDRRRPRRSAAAPRRDKRFYDAWPLALRYEALLRVFNDPAPFARRLAARLRRAPQLIAAILRAPPEAVHRIDDFELMGETGAHAWAAAPDSS